MLRTATLFTPHKRLVSSLSPYVLANQRSFSGGSWCAGRLAAKRTVGSLAAVTTGGPFFSAYPFGVATQVRSYANAPPVEIDPADIRNVAIIAHVDHGKTTLVDCLLKQSGTLSSTDERVMDSNAQEQERGITILSKVTRIAWNEKHFNIVDTPGHGDFGSEVERVLSMVDGVVILVDVVEGPMTQTKYVVSKAIRQKLRPIIIINKMDRIRNSAERAKEIEGEMFDLFCNLEASEEQINYTTLYASSREGWVSDNPETPANDVSVLFKTIYDKIPPPKVRDVPHFSMLVSNMEYDSFLGRLLTGRIYSGSIKAGDKLYAKTDTGTLVESGNVLKVLVKKGLTFEPIEIGAKGDIISFAGLTKSTVGYTISSISDDQTFPAPEIDPPVVCINFTINTSPLAGKEGSFVSTKHLSDRLEKEKQANVGLTINKIANDTYEVSGRGELHLTVLIESMRREGYELSVTRPKIIFKKEGDKVFEPLEEVFIDIESTYSGAVLNEMTNRKAELVDLKQTQDKTRITYKCLSRAIFGLRDVLNSFTKGSAIINSSFHSYVKYDPEAYQEEEKGSLICGASGKSTAHALSSIESRGYLYIGPQVEVYEGMVIGQHNRDNDIEVNPAKEKQLTNFRTTSKEEAIRLQLPRKVTLESALSWVKDDELIEVTPNNIRIRKARLTASERKRK